MGVERVFVVADVKHGVDGGNVDEFACRLVHLVHRIGQILSRPDDDGHDFVFHQLGKHLVKGKIGVVDFLADSDVSQVDDLELGPMVEEGIKGLADMLDAIGASFIVDGTTFFLDTDDGQIHTFEAGKFVLVVINANSFSQGLFARTEVLSETLFGYRLKENADVHGGINRAINPPLTVIAGLTRNLPGEKDSSSRLGDGGCSSAMTVKG